MPPFAPRRHQPRTRTMEVFNNGMPLRVVRADDGRLGIVDEARMHVWFGYEFKSTRVSRVPTREIVLPPLPQHYGKFDSKAIGGVSKTLRRVGCIRTTHKHSGAVVVFATRAPTPSCVADALHSCTTVAHTVGESEVDEEFGNVTEIVVHESSDVDHVCAIVARCGAIPILEDTNLNARQGIGVERLDRIPSKSLDGDQNDDATQFGVRRGERNWRFAWLPDHWRPPITWDHLIGNVGPCDIESLSQPLRQHVAHDRIRRGVHDPLGSRWRVAEVPPTPMELSMMTHEGGSATLRTVLRHSELSTALASSERVPSHLVDALSIDSVQYLARSDDGRWFRPLDTRSILHQQIPGSRLVSAALEDSQSEQLINAFYVLSVECVPDALIREAASLILFRYMIERGYTARWMGKYVQDALYIGNGDRFRNFRRLSQYAPDRLPINVLNKLCETNGCMRNKGSKGTRSKYRTTNRYIPKRRLKRTREHEDSMITGPGVASVARDD